MDAAFVPSQLVVKHYVSHTFTLELGPSIIALGKPIRNILYGAAILFCITGLVRSTLQAVLKTGDRK
jgi:hypothetical protein